MKNAILLFSCIICLSCKETKHETKQTDEVEYTSKTVTKPQVTAKPNSTEPPSDTLESMIRKIPLQGAIDQFKPGMRDHFNDADSGGVLLGMWFGLHSNKDTATIFISKNETNYALVQKDSDTERGKKMCVNGSLIQINKETDDPVMFEGLLMNSEGQLFQFLASKSTGNLVGGSYAKFCGIVIGKFDYSNSGGGTGHAVNLVGVFDLPENKK